MAQDQGLGRSVASIRRSLLDLPTLPIRPRSARAILGSEGFDGSIVIDPASALTLARGKRPGLRLVTRSPWWPAATEAVDRLWRHSIAVAWEARRLALAAGLEPDRLALVGLLAPLGLWAVAAVEPSALGPLLDLPEGPSRSDLARGQLGIDPGNLGRALAERWRVDPILAAIAWRGPDPAGGPDPSAPLRLLREAYRTAQRTPWRLGPGPIVGEPARALTARVVGLCLEGFAEPDAGRHEPRLAREHAKSLLQIRKLRRDESRRLDLLAEIAGVANPSRKGSESGRRLDTEAESAYRALVEERDRLLDLVERLHLSLERASGSTVAEPALDRDRDRDRLAEFAAGAGHELNNPLAVIQGRAQLLIARTGDPEAVRSLRAIVGQAQRAHQVIRDLMFYARPPAPRPRACRPLDVAEGAIADFRVEAESVGVRLADRVEGQVGLVETEPETIRQVLEVLLRNALQVTPSGGAIEVIARASADRVDWSIQDGGPGLRPGEAERMFDPFYCGRQAGRGLGLGLPRARAALARLGGQLTWSLGPGRGMTFHASVPCQPIAPAPEIRSIPPLPATILSESTNC